MSKSKLLTAMKNNVGKTLTENGALTPDKSGSKVLDFYSKGAAYRVGNRSEADIVSAFEDAYDEDALLALKTLFYIRDIRGGQGERNTSRVCLKWLATNHPSVFIKNIENIVKFGRFDDLFVALEADNTASTAVFAFIKKQLGKDARCKDDSKLSLLAKWMPSINTSSAETRALAHKFIKYLKVTPRKYRKTLSALRERLNVVERLISANEWSEVNFEHVPSKANLLYKKAFSKHEPERYVQFIKAVQSGEKKINASTLFPYEVVRDCNQYSIGQNEDTLDVLWKSMPDFLATNPHNGLVLPDVSGSMAGLPIQVSVSLAIYFAQRSKGFFKDHFLEFSSTAVLRKIKSKKIADAWREVSQSTNWCGSTNLQSAFDAILKAAKANSLTQEDLPDVLYIISDMEFNQACTSNSKSNFEVIKSKFASAGYKMPVICFWNVSARNDHSPVTRDENGTILVSGCSPSIFSQVISGVTTTPYDFMLETLNKERYASVVV